jgi:hypothetical protein
MKIITNQVTTDEDIAAMVWIRQQVFEREMGIKLGPATVPNNGNIAQLLACAEPGKEPVGTLSVIDTSGDRQLHVGFGLKFEPDARVARYMHLAVLKPYRGMNIPLMMMLEAHRRIIIPRRFDYTWLLFDVERASTSFLCQRLGFTPAADTFVSEYGCRCPLVRDERRPQARESIGQAEAYLRQSQNPGALTEVAHVGASLRA